MKRLMFCCLLLFVTGCSRQVLEYEEIYVPQEKRYVPSVPVVIIDPGHGGKDRGAHSDKNPIYEEKRLTLQTAKLISHYLTKMGHKNQLTRNKDVFLSLKERSHLANKSGTLLFVSVHYNTAPSKQADGIEIFYHENKAHALKSHQSKSFAQDVLRTLIQSTHAKSRGVKHGNLSVIRETAMPAILVEAGFLTNQMEREKIHTGNYMHCIARGIANGIDAHLKRVVIPK